MTTPSSLLAERTTVRLPPRSATPALTPERSRIVVRLVERVSLRIRSRPPPDSRTVALPLFVPRAAVPPALPGVAPPPLSRLPEEPRWLAAVPDPDCMLAPGCTPESCA